jgi:uncharacterized protein (TIGR04255 family)
MGKKMDNAPVYFSIIQVRFNAVMAMESYINQIQEIFRKQNFADFKKVVEASALLNADAAEPTVSMQQRTKYFFADRDGCSAFDIQPTSISFRTTKYDVFEKFSEQFFKGLESVHNIVGFDFYDRIGIRYLNAVYPMENKKLSHYLHPSVQTLADHIPGQLIHGYSETTVNKGGVLLVTRTITRDGEVGFPQDLTEMPIPEKFKTMSGRNAIIDTDAAINSRQDFNIPNIKQQAFKIQKEAEDAFKLSVTPFALKEWA